MISKKIYETMTSKGASVIRKMFEEGVALKKQYGEDNVFDFSLGNPDLDPPEEVVEAVLEVARDTAHGRHGYMPNAGYPECRSAMAEKVSLEQGVKIEGSDVVVTVGAASALISVMKAILNPDDEIIVPSPFFAEYRNYVANFPGCKLNEVQSREDFSLNFEGIKNALSEKTAAVLINTPNNPTGKVYSENDIVELCGILNAHGEKTGRYPYLICDEPYRAIIYDGKKVPSVFDKYKFAVVVSSFAKNLSVPGERIGYIAVNGSCPEKTDFIAACIFSFRTLGFVNAPAFFQKVLAKSWNCKADLSSYEKRRNMLMDVLDDAGIKYYRPEGAFYLFVKVPENFKGDDGEFCDYLKKYFILCAPGSGFGGKGWFRMAYCVSEKTIEGCRKAFKKAMEELGN